MGDVAARLQAARDRLGVARELRDVAERLAEAERRRFELGAGTLLIVNLREQSAADAELQYLQTAAEASAASMVWRTLDRVACNARAAD